MWLLYILWVEKPVFMILGSNELLTAVIEIHPTKAWFHTWGISKMQSDTLKEPYAIKFCFKLWKKNATETYGMLQTAFRESCMNQASVFE